MDGSFLAAPQLSVRLGDKMIVYQLTSNKHALSNLKNKRIKISKIEELNDPFELLGAQLGGKRLRASFKEMRQNIAKKRGILCFSKYFHNPVLWGHYGDKHYGIGLGFEVPESELQEVNYVPSRKLVNFNPSDGKTTLNEESMLQLLCQKFEDWCYESEYRGWANLDEKDNETELYFSNFSKNLRLRKIIIGPRNSAKPKDIKDLIGASIRGVKIIKSRLAFKSYSVVENKRYKILTT
jgi:hypothetical protein